MYEVSKNYKTYSSMKILIDGRFWGTENAGLGRYTINLVEGLGEIDRKNKYILLLRKKYFGKLNLPDNWTPLLADYKHYGIVEQIMLPGLISTHRPDIVHFLHFNTPFFFKGQYIVTIHDILMHKQKGLAATTLPFYSYFIKRLGYKTVFRRAVMGAESVIVPSKSVKKEVVDYYRMDPGKIKVTYEGLDERILRKEDRETVLDKYNINSSYFIYAGNAYPHKNLKRLIEAIILLNRELNMKVLLVMATSRGVFEKRLKSDIKKAGAAEYVKLLGYVPDSDLGTLYGNSLAFVFPSLSEGFGLPGLEALASGTMLIASDIAVFREVYGSSASYFNPYNFSSIEKAMKNIIQLGDNKRENAIKEGKEFAKRYSWSKMARETLRIYEDSFGLRSGK